MICHNKTLTICIPTYNRRKFLEECINSIIYQVDDDIRPLLEIYIFDNASNDGTREYCEKLTSDYSYIRYFRNSENLGPDGNFYKILKCNVNSCFKHLLSDDDKYAPGALKSLLEFLSEHSDLHFVYLNYASFKSDESNVISKALNPANDTFTYITKYKLISIIRNEYSFLSGMVFNSSAINLEGVDKFTKTYWLQSYALFKSTVNSENKLAFFGLITVYKRSDDVAASYNMFKVFGSNYFELAKFAYENCGYDKKQMQKMVSIRWKKLLFWAKLNNFDKSEYRDIILISKKEKYLKKILIYAKMPHWFCVLYHKLKYILK